MMIHNRNLSLIALFTFLSCGFSFALKTDLKPVNLRTEYKTDPVTDVSKPRLSWELISDVRGQEQTAYQVMVSSSTGLLAAGNADIWNPGKVAGNATNQIEFGGKPMRSRSVCFWKVRSW